MHAAMAPSMFSRLKGRFSGAPAIKATPEEQTQDREVLEEAITKAVCYLAHHEYEHATLCPTVSTFYDAN